MEYFYQRTLGRKIILKKVKSSIIRPKNNREKNYELRKKIEKIEAYGTTEEAPCPKVNLGATFNFGKLKVDGNLGMNNVSLFNLNAFFANAPITYWY